MENDILTRARVMVSQLSQCLSQSSSSPITFSPSMLLSPSVTSPTTSTSRAPKVKNQPQYLEALTTASAALVVELRSAIQETVVSEDTERMARLLSVNDELLELMKRIPSLERNATPVAGNADDSEANRKGPRLVLQGLGLSFDGSTTLDSEVQQDEVPQSIDVSLKPRTDAILDLSDPVTNSLTTNCVEGLDEGVEGSLTPRIDKGKGRAEPAEEKHERILSPSYPINSDSDEEDERRLIVEMSTFSPTER